MPASARPCLACSSSGPPARCCCTRAQEIPRPGATCAMRAAFTARATYMAARARGSRAAVLKPHPP
eukprot:2657268-Lingulodinium_polyedra.AAC.1